MQVIRHVDGPCLVIAVPGSGKTASLTERVRYLLSVGVKPYTILAITFTNKAAKEMKERIAKAVGSDLSSKMVICTFHSFCVRLLRLNLEGTGLSPGFTICDDDDQKNILKQSFCKVLGLEKKSEIDQEDFNSIMAYMERTRNACIDDESRSILPFPWQYQVVDEYYSRLEQSNAVDFTGLLSKTLDLLSTNSTVLEKYQDRFRYISVDEVQDTNVAQYRIISLLARKHKNIMLIGDTDQSIYRFRNASPENILRFEQDFGARLLKLETNYRSTPQVLRCAQSLIENNSMRKETSLETGNSSGPEPSVLEFENDELMAANTANFIARRIRGGTHPSEVAILYRIKSATRVLEQALRREGVKYKIIGGHSFYERKEVKVSMAILRMMVNPNDAMAFSKCVEFCCRGVGPKSTIKILDSASGVGLTGAISDFCMSDNKQAKIVSRFVNLLSEAREMPPYDGLLHVAKGTSFWRSMQADKNSQEDRCGNILEMSRDVEKYMTDNPGKGLDKYLQDVSLVSSADEESDKDKINLLTIHASKGLEFEVVVISHMCDGIVPHQNALDVEDIEDRYREIEEERRLLYVAMTRAKRWLRMTYCRRRFKNEMEPSRFLSEIDLKSNCIIS